MPIYEYACEPCDRVIEEYRAIDDRDNDLRCRCGRSTTRIISAAVTNAWKNDRKFDNLDWRGDGTKSFETKAEYEAHLKANNFAEDDPIRRKKRGAVTKVLSDGRGQGGVRPRPGSW